MDRNQEYIRLLQERNRMKKALTEKSPEELQKEELEKGFSINFRGANAPKQAPSKVLDKPVVKVQKGLSADIARRLLGGGDDTDQQSAPVSKKRWTVDENDGDEPSADDEPRSRSASAHRRRKSASEEITPRNDESNDQVRSTKKKATKDKGKGKVDDVLLQRIKSMTAEQKKALLDLLQIPDPTLDDDDDEEEDDQEGIDNEEAIAQQFTGRKAEAADAMQLHTASEEDAVITASEVTPTNVKSEPSSSSFSRDQHDRRQVSSTAPPSSEAVTAPSYDWSRRKFNIRVKIFSTWDDCKNCVLQALRCRVQIANGQYIDLLPSFKAQVFCGFNALPTTLEVCRKLPCLLAVGHSFTTVEQWKGPVTLTQPLELVFEGSLSNNGFENHGGGSWSEYFTDEEALLQQTELWIWNGFQEDSGVNYSPAKDMDVYVDGKCIWSGQLPSGSTAVDVTKASTSLYSPLKYESNPSMKLPFVPPEKKPSKATQAQRDNTTATSSSATASAAAAAAAAAAAREDILSKVTSPPRKASSMFASGAGSSNSSSSGNPSTRISRATDIDFSSDTAAASPYMPGWSTANTTRKATTADNGLSLHEIPSFTNSSSAGPPPSLRRPDDIVFNSPPRPSSGAGSTVKVIKSPDPTLAMIPEGAIPAKKAVSRGSRRNAQRQSQNQLDIIPETGDMPPSQSSPTSSVYPPRSSSSTSLLLQGPSQATMMQSRQSTKPDDAALRRSLDAVQRAEKFNLNRLEKTREMDVIFASQEDAWAAAADNNVNKGGGTASIHTPVSSPPAASSAKTTYSAERTTSRNPLQFSPSSPNSGRKAAAAPGAARLEKRAANIGEFSAKLTTTINEVNDILACLPRKPSMSSLTTTSPSAVGGTARLAVPTSVTLPSTVSATAPAGRILTIRILSTYGDANYVGLNGLELFDERGALIPSTAVSISAIPADLTILPGYEDDPRKVTNLLDGVNHTKDDLHQWLAPQLHVAQDYLTANEKTVLATLMEDPATTTVGAGLMAVIRVDFRRPIQLAMIRLYNFNKSRTHNQRGVKDIRIDFDGNEVFTGAVAKATGGPNPRRGDVDDCLSITLSRDVRVLDTIAAQTTDALQMMPGTIVEEEEAAAALEESMVSVQSRPKTAAPPDESLSQVALLGETMTTATTMTSGGVGVLDENTFDDDERLDVVEGDEDVVLQADNSARRPPVDDENDAEQQAIQDSLQTSTDFLQAILQETDAIQMRAAYQQRLQQAKMGAASASASASASATMGSPPTMRRVPEATATTTMTMTPSATLHTAATGAYGSSSGSVSSTVSYVRTLSVRHIRLELLSTWGDSEYIGLGGLEVLNIHGHALRLTKAMLRCNSCLDLGDGFGGSTAERSDLNHLLLTGHDTANTHAMWLVPMDHDRKRVVLDIDLQGTHEITGLRLWNYNGTTIDEILRGCRLITLSFDHGRVALPTLLLRPGPMCDGVRFAQAITFDRWVAAMAMQQQQQSYPSRVGGALAYITPRLKQAYEVLTPVTGMSFTFAFYSNHGDHYYLGLDRMEFLDEELRVLDVLSLADVTAVPYSVRDLAASTPSLAQDPRIPPAVFLPSHATTAASSSQTHLSAWLSPLPRSMLPAERDVCVQRLQQSSSSSSSVPRKAVLPTDNTFFVFFHFPVRVAAIRLWNYSKTPARGVKEFSLTVDGNTVFMGNLLSSVEEKKVDALSRSEVPGSSRGQVMLFSNETRLVNQFKDLVITATAADQDVLCINERQVMVRSKTMYQEPPVQVDIQQRPTTSFVHR